jgi:hypothetical protein
MLLVRRLCILPLTHWPSFETHPVSYTYVTEMEEKLQLNPSLFNGHCLKLCVFSGIGTVSFDLYSVYSNLKMDQMVSFKDKKSHSFKSVVPSFQIWSLHGYFCYVKNMSTCLLPNIIWHFSVILADV